MKGFNSDWLKQYDARNAKPNADVPVKPVTSEGALHDDVFNECRRRGWLPLHGAMCERTHRTEGEWDFTILADNGRVFFMELKKKNGKTSTKQNELIAWAKRLGHTVHVIRSMEEFYSICQ